MIPPILIRIAPIGALSIALVLGACGGAGGDDGEPSEEARQPLTVLREAPPFELESLEGDSLSLDDLSDRKAILMNFWASWCAPCRAEIPELIELHEAYKDEGFMVLGVTVNDLPRDSRAFVDEMEMTYPSVIGTPAMLEDYRLSPWLPTTLLVKDGQVVREWVGPRTREEFEYPIRVALGKAPDLGEVVKPRDEAPGDEGEPPPGAEPAEPPPRGGGPSGETGTGPER